MKKLVLIALVGISSVALAEQDSEFYSQFKQAVELVNDDDIRVGLMCSDALKRQGKKPEEALEPIIDAYLKPNQTRRMNIDHINAASVMIRIETNAMFRFMKSKDFTEKNFANSLSQSACKGKY